jgi:hypothetical protein
MLNALLCSVCYTQQSISQRREQAMAARYRLWQQKNRYGNTWLYPSEQYQHKSDDLWRQYQNGYIDYARYLELLEAIKTEEIDRRNKKYPLLARDPERKERIENGIWEYERLSQNARAKEAQRKAEAERIKSLTPLEK